MISNCFILVFWGIIIFLLLFCLITNSVYIIKHKKDLKYLFKIDEEHKFRDISQIIVHSSIIILLIILNLSIYMDMKIPKTRPFDDYHAMMKVVAHINQATLLDYQLENKTNIDSLENFMNSIIKRTNSVSLYSYHYDGIKTQNFSKQKINKYNLSEIEGKPTIFLDSYGSMFSVIKFKNGCSFYDDENVLNSDCVILIDGNGTKPPNEYKKDRAYLYIKGDEIPVKIIPEEL